jgi:hypothetical protein
MKPMRRRKVTHIHDPFLKYVSANAQASSLLGRCDLSISIVTPP